MPRLERLERERLVALLPAVDTAEEELLEAQHRVHVRWVVGAHAALGERLAELRDVLADERDRLLPGHRHTRRSRFDALLVDLRLYLPRCLRATADHVYLLRDWADERHRAVES